MALKATIVHPGSKENAPYAHVFEIAQTRSTGAQVAHLLGELWNAKTQCAHLNSDQALGWIASQRATQKAGMTLTSADWMLEDFLAYADRLLLPGASVYFHTSWTALPDQA